jgi:hypothetical protein
MDNKAMARGWESKSVEAQQADAAEVSSTPRPRLTAEQAERLREKQNLTMARTSIVRQLESASDPRYRALLEQTLKEVEDKLLHLPA